MAVDERIRLRRPVDDHRFYRLHTGHHRTVSIDVIKIQCQALTLIAQQTDETTEIGWNTVLDEGHCFWQVNEAQSKLIHPAAKVGKINVRWSVVGDGCNRGIILIWIGGGVSRDTCVGSRCTFSDIGNCD